MNRLITKSIICASVLLVAAAAQAAPKYNTQFKGWNGKQQRSSFLNTSTWHSCFNDRGGSCGSTSMTTGSSSCTTTGFDVGGGFDLPIKIPGLNVYGGFNKSWTACNVKSETITCSPNRGWKGRAAVLFSQRVGTLRMTGGNPREYRGKWNENCARGYRKSLKASGVGTIQVYTCTFRDQFETRGYLPEFRTHTCDYKRI
jgi:hypothetical protein